VTLLRLLSDGTGKSLSFVRGHMTITHRCLLAAMLVCATSAQAGNTDYVFLDVAHCKKHGVTTEPTWDDPSTRDALLKEADGYTIFTLGDRLGYGYCQEVGAGGFSNFPLSVVCRTVSRGFFPMAGATYTLRRTKSPIPSYLCSTGCARSVPAVIYHAGYEGPPDQKNTDYLTAVKFFQKKCGLR
jgi:hypothetical protein